MTSACVGCWVCGCGTVVPVLFRNSIYSAIPEVLIFFGLGPKKISIPPTTHHHPHASSAVLLRKSARFAIRFQDGWGTKPRDFPMSNPGP